MEKHFAHNFLKKAQEAYEKGQPFLTDEEFDLLAEKFKFFEVGYTPTKDKEEHVYPLYSLEKKWEEDNPTYPNTSYVVTPKLDGTAISLLYVNGDLVRVLTRGNGKEGVNITDKFLATDIVPHHIPTQKIRQIDGELVAPKTIENTRNYAAGAANLKDIEEFKTRDLTFIAYAVRPYIWSDYYRDMHTLSDWGFNIVTESAWSAFPQDGKVVRVLNNEEFDELGYTDKYPKGAFAIKKRADIAIEETVLREVRWQVKRGKVTPVAIFDPVVIEDATITKATLHNAGFVESLDLHIGDTILVTRSGGVIPKVVGKI